MKIYIFTDLEGISGVHQHLGLTPEGGKLYDKYCEYLTEEVNAAVEGAFRAGAAEVLVNDGHCAGSNILIEKLDSRAKLATGTNKKGSWGAGLEKGFAGVVFIGAHAMSGTEDAVLDHTMSSLNWQNLWLNKKLIGEIGLGAYYFGECGLPIVFVSGDDKACAEARKTIKGVFTAETKKGLGRESAILYPLKQVRESITDGVERAVQNVSKFKPLKPKYPVTLLLEMKHTNAVDGITPVPGRKILDSRHVEYKPGTIRNFLNLL